MNRSRSALVAICTAALAFTACGGADDTSGNQHSDDCPVSIRDSLPTDGSTDFYYRQSIEFHLSEADTTNPIASLLSGDTVVHGRTWYGNDNKTVYFTPDDPLTPQTDYTATLDYCAGDASIDFSTSEIGLPLTADLTGRTYVLDLFSARFIQPAIFNQILESVMTKKVLVGVTGVAENSLDLMLAVSQEDSNPPVQDFCKKSIPIAGGADFSEDPFFSLGPTDMDFDLAQGSITIRDLKFSGTFAADGSFFSGGVLGGQADAREIAAANAFVKFQGMDGHDICDYLKNTLGVLCDACSTDQEPFCLDIQADSIPAAQLVGTTIQEVDEAYCHELCPTNSKDCHLRAEGQLERVSRVRREALSRGRPALTGS